jgi:hypothetical protein
MQNKGKTEVEDHKLSFTGQTLVQNKIYYK